MYNKIHYVPFNDLMDNNNVCYPAQFNHCTSVPYVACCPYVAAQQHQCTPQPQPTVDPYVQQYPCTPQSQPMVNPYAQQVIQMPHAVKKNANINNPYPANPKYCDSDIPQPDGGYGTGKITIYGPNLKGLYIIYDNRCHMYGTTMTSEELCQYIRIYDHFDDIDTLLYNNIYHLLPDEKDAIDNLVLSFDNIENIEKFENENIAIFDIFSKMSDVAKTDHSISFAFNDKAPTFLRKYIVNLDCFINMD